MDGPGVLLEESVNFSDLINAGATYSINTDSIYTDDVDNPFYDQIDETDRDIDYQKMLESPWKWEFEELKKNMIPLNNFIYKRTTKEGDVAIPADAKVKIQYNAYWEKAVQPYDSTYLRGQPHKFTLGTGEVIDGLEMAVVTMKKFEEAQFIISYHALYGERGCPPRIPPKADALFVIKVENFYEAGDSSALDNMTEENAGDFETVFKRANDVYLSGKEKFKMNNMDGAIKSFHKACQWLAFCHMKNDAEQAKQQERLKVLYLNMAICYNRQKQPKKACCMLNELRRIDGMKGNAKAYFNLGKALRMIGEYDKARIELKKALGFAPGNKEIFDELELLSQQRERYKEQERTLALRAFGAVATKAWEKENQGVELDKDFQALFEDFIAGSLQELVLPSTLSKEEISLVKKLERLYPIRLETVTTSTESHYKLVKTN